METILALQMLDVAEQGAALLVDVSIPTECPSLWSFPSNTTMDVSADK